MRFPTRSTVQAHPSGGRRAKTRFEPSPRANSRAGAISQESVRSEDARAPARASLLVFIVTLDRPVFKDFEPAGDRGLNIPQRLYGRPTAADVTPIDLTPSLAATRRSPIPRGKGLFAAASRVVNLLSHA